MLTTENLTSTIIEQQEGLVTITLNRPRRKNAIGSAMWNELDRAI